MAERYHNTAAAQEAHAGQAQRADTRAVRTRAETPDLLEQAQLDVRQARIGADRWRGGPPLAGEAGAGSAPADVPATACEEPEP